jgi:hypothetical protein
MNFSASSSNLSHLINASFDKVIVMAEDKGVKENRLSLLQRIAMLFGMPLVQGNCSGVCNYLITKRCTMILCSGASKSSQAWGRSWSTHRNNKHLLQ